MAEKTVAQKMRIRPGACVALLNAPEGLAASLGLPEDTPIVGAAKGADVVLVYTGTRAELERRLPALHEAMTPDTALWIVFPKGAKAAGLDISRDVIWQLAESLGMRPVGLVSIDGLLSGFRLKRGE